MKNNSALEINKSKVSIIMGVYNCEKTISGCIQSILEQSYKNWELIMCDDGSHDNTFEIAKNYENRHPDKIKVIQNNKNLTLGPTLNKCLKLATGEYIARQDSDDLSHKDRIEKQVDFLEKNNQFELIGTSMLSFDENGVYGKRNPKELPIREDLMKGTTFAHATIMVRSEIIRKLNGYSESKWAKGVEDYELWFRFFEQGFRGANLNEALYYVREDRDAYSRKSFRRRLNEIGVIYNGRRRLKLSVKFLVFILKPIMAILIPRRVLKNYHRSKFSKNL